MGNSSMFSSFNGLIYSTPTPSSISYQWNFGSLLGMCLLIQIISGLFLSFYYSSSTLLAFASVEKICEEVSSGSLVRIAHANGASFFFIWVYLHIARGVAFGSYVSHPLPWVAGVVILLVLIASAFLGYVLPWGQISLWGATVITNLLSTLPIGESLVQWIWGSFSVSEPTLVRFFSLHFILPFLLGVLIVIHILLLHLTGSSNPLGIDSNSDKVFFHPFFSSNDVVGLFGFTALFLTVSILIGDLFIDPDNFIPANPISTPPIIQPEWYFLFAYAILRSIPSKLGGVIALFSSIGVLLLLPISNSNGSGVNKWIVSSIIFSSFILLTWVGAIPVEYPFVLVSQILATVYFTSFVLLLLLE